MRNRNVTIWVMVLVVICGRLQKADGMVVFNDGQTHTIDYVIDDQVEVEDSTFFLEPTTVNFVQGGDATGEVRVNENSVVNVMGASLTSALAVWDTAQGNLFDGYIPRVSLLDRAIFNMHGGTMGTNLYGNYQSCITVSGGHVQGNVSSTIDSSVSISGGTFDGYLHAGDNGLLTIIGSDFAVDGQPAPFGQYVGEREGILTGVLANGDLIDNWYYGTQNGTLILIPEPATLLLLGLGVPILSGLRRKR